MKSTNEPILFEKACAIASVAVSDDPTRHAISLMRISGNTIAGTDGHRLFITTFERKHDPEVPETFVCLPGTYHSLRDAYKRALPGMLEDYPDVERVIPRWVPEGGPAPFLTMRASDLKRAVRMLQGKGMSAHVAVRFMPGEPTGALMRREDPANPKDGEPMIRTHQLRVPISAVERSEWHGKLSAETVGLNPRYLIDMLDAALKIDPDMEITLRADKTDEPVVMTCPGCVLVTMPMHE